MVPPRPSAQTSDGPSRRTVTKYRQLLKLAPVERRRKVAVLEGTTSGPATNGSMTHHAAG